MKNMAKKRMRKIRKEGRKKMNKLKAKKEEKIGMK